jgi:hypothetical protein
MSACALRRWGTACSSVRPPDTGQSKEMEKSLQIMIAERNKQDAIWSSQGVIEPSNIPLQNHSQNQTNK